MSIEQKIKESFMQAYKNKDLARKDFLGVIKGEIENAKKVSMTSELSDESVSRILKKIYKGASENLEHRKDPTFQWQIEILSEFLPKEMSEDEIRSHVNELIFSGISTLGEIMKSFKDLPADKSLLSKIAKESLNKS